MVKISGFADRGGRQENSLNTRTAQQD